VRGHFLTHVPALFCPGWHRRRSANRAWVPPIRRDLMPVAGAHAVRRLTRPVSRLSRRGGRIEGLLDIMKNANFKARRPPRGRFTHPVFPGKSYSGSHRPEREKRPECGLCEMWSAT
jgi:hypothetical protein